MKLLQACILNVLLFLLSSMPAANASAESQSCLEVAFDNPRGASMYADFYSDYEDKKAFAQEFFQQIQSQLNNSSQCQVNTKKVKFTCVEGNGSYPVCGGKVNNYYVRFTRTV